MKELINKVFKDPFREKKIKGLFRRHEELNKEPFHVTG